MDTNAGVNKNRTNWRRRFIELAEQIFRELGFAVPAMLHEDNLPLAMDFEINGMPFELLHTVGESNEWVKIVCKLGPIPQTLTLRGMEFLMHQNLRNIREHADYFGFSPESQELILIGTRELDVISAEGLLNDLKQITRDLSDWETFFFDPKFNLENPPVGGLHTILA